MPLVTSSHSSVLAPATGPLAPPLILPATFDPGETPFGCAGPALRFGKGATAVFAFGDGVFAFGDGAFVFGDTVLAIGGFGEGVLLPTGVVLPARCGGTGGGLVNVSIGLVRIRGWGRLESSGATTATVTAAATLALAGGGGWACGRWTIVVLERSSGGMRAWEQRVLTELRSSVARPSHTQSWALATGRRGCGGGGGGAVATALLTACGEGERRRRTLATPTRKNKAPISGAKTDFSCCL